jgi:putative membrane protein
MMLGGGMFIGWIFGLAVIVVVIWLVARLAGPRYRAFSNSRAMEILKERFAKGEINREQYEESRRALMNG